MNRKQRSRQQVDSMHVLPLSSLKPCICIRTHAYGSHAYGAPFCICNKLARIRTLRSPHLVGLASLQGGDLLEWPVFVRLCCLLVHEPILPHALQVGRNRHLRRSTRSAVVACIARTQQRSLMAASRTAALKSFHGGMLLSHQPDRQAQAHMAMHMLITVLPHTCNGHAYGHAGATYTHP